MNRGRTELNGGADTHDRARENLEEMGVLA